MLAYVFWHTSGIEQSLQQARLIAFHEALAAHPPEGFIRSAVFSCESLPWTPGGRLVYEDWYLIDDFAALGRLNDAAVRPPRSGAHDAAARGADWGAGGLYLVVGGSAIREDLTHVSWMAKPDGMSYDAFYESIPGNVEIWRRQLVLSAGPEFCIRGSGPIESDHSISREMKRIWVGS